MPVAKGAESVMTAAAERELARHPGEWAALSGGEVVATGETPAEVIATARALGASDLVLYRVPTKEERHATFY